MVVKHFGCFRKFHNHYFTIFKQKIQVALFSPVILFIVSRETFFCVSPFYVSRETFSQIKAFNNAAAPAATRFL